MIRPGLFSRSYASVKLHWKRLLAELLVVFVGVYGAFWLNAYREEEHQRQVRQNYYHSFIAELTAINKHAKKIAADTDTLHQRYSAAIAKGERPLLKVHPELDFPINMFIIRSSFNQQHFESIDRKYLVNVSMGSNLISFLEKRLNLFQEKSRDLMMLTAGDASVLYAADASLRPGYQWYLDDLALISIMAKQLTYAVEQGAVPDAEKLLAELEK